MGRAETAGLAERRRQLRGYRFDCRCERCAAEAVEQEVVEEEEEAENEEDGEQDGEEEGEPLGGSASSD